MFPSTVFFFTPEQRGSHSECMSLSSPRFSPCGWFSLSQDPQSVFCGSYQVSGREGLRSSWFGKLLAKQNSADFLAWRGFQSFGCSDGRHGLGELPWRRDIKYRIFQPDWPQNPCKMGFQAPTSEMPRAKDAFVLPSYLCSQPFQCSTESYVFSG